MIICYQAHTGESTRWMKEWLWITDTCLLCFISFKQHTCVIRRIGSSVSSVQIVQCVKCVESVMLSWVVLSVCVSLSRIEVGWVTGLFLAHWLQKSVVYEPSWLSADPMTALVNPLLTPTTLNLSSSNFPQTFHSPNWSYYCRSVHT